MRVRTLAVVIASLLVAQVALAQPAKPGPTPKPGPTGAPNTPTPEPPPPPPPPEPPVAPPLSESLTGEAKADYDAGKILIGDGDFAGALIKFTRAYDSSKDPRLLWNMAACEKNLRHYAKTLKLVRRYLADGNDKLSGSDKTEANDLIKVIEPLTSKLTLRVNEPGAEVVIDDEVIGTTPIEPVIVDIGTRKVRVRKGEFEEFGRDVSVSGTADVPLDVNLTKIVHEGRLNVRSSQEATIMIDGKTVGAGTWSGALPSGGHTLRITAPKMLPYQAEVLLQDKENRDLNVTLDPEPSKGLPVWAWIAGGALVAGGLTTAGILIFKPDNTYEGPSGNLTQVGAGGVVDLFRRH